MSRIALSPPASGTATFTLSAPATNTDRTLTLPDSTGTVATAESTLAQFNASGSAPVYACRAWVNFNGTGTVAIRASGNVSSVTDAGGTGNYFVNFTTAMQDANYSVVCNGSNSDGENDFAFANGANQSSGSIQILTTGDSAHVSVAIFR